MAAALQGYEGMVDYCLDHHCNVDLQINDVSKMASYYPWCTSHCTLTDTNIYRMAGQPCIMQLPMAD